MYVLFPQANNMILQTAVEYFHKLCTAGNGVSTSEGTKRVLPHIVSSHMEHPAVNVMLQHLEDTEQAGTCNWKMLIPCLVKGC